MAVDQYGLLPWSKSRKRHNCNGPDCADADKIYCPKNEQKAGLCPNGKKRKKRGGNEDWWGLPPDCVQQDACTMAGKSYQTTCASIPPMPISRIFDKKECELSANEFWGECLDRPKNHCTPKQIKRDTESLKPPFLRKGK